MQLFIAECVDGQGRRGFSSKTDGNLKKSKLTPLRVKTCDPGPLLPPDGVLKEYIWKCSPPSLLLHKHLHWPFLVSAHLAFQYISSQVNRGDRVVERHCGGVISLEKQETKALRLGGSSGRAAMRSVTRAVPWNTGERAGNRRFQGDAMFVSVRMSRRSGESESGGSSRCGTSTGARAHQPARGAK
ncbi:hypothetical protein JZ751_021531 [Albula glossodonta]|uniref:Uncharacterized protein n=1 Tax=Albula glossodonta TaxID=121402 RepID=A0A8T2NS97_9TELE|nr:hypothetical protein JZ751_021531 [Albula glossodonta]